ncbi:MAG: hypothetical protein EOM31_10530 [Bacteroidia bacterium]|nr:hypothetical protein [Bacteroidia bacterium]
MRNLRQLLVLFFCCAAILFTACKKDHNEPEPPEVKTRTLLVYIVADNNGLSRFATEDINEMKEGLSTIDTNHHNLLVYLDNGTSTQLIQLTKESNGEVVKKVIKDYGPQNSLDVTFMKGVFSEAFTQFPAESYAIDFWSHGEGWLPTGTTTRWWGQDGGSGTKMDIKELHQALRSAPHFDFILFDSCFMQAIEVAYQLRDCADFFIGSPTEIPGPGAPYKEVVQACFSKNSGEALARYVALNYYQPYEQIYNGDRPTTNDYWSGGVSMGVLKSSELVPFAEATRKVLTTFLSNQGGISTNDLLYYGRGGRYYYYYDFNSFIKKVTTGNEEAYADWKSAFDKTIIQFDTTAKNYSGSENTYPYGLFPMTGMCGLSTYIPQGINPTFDTYYQTLDWYAVSGWKEVMEQR